MTPQIKFVVLGLGHIGKRHCSVICNNADAKLVAVVDIDSRLEAKVQEDYQVPFFTSLDSLFASNLAFDVVNVCTPNGYHCIHTLAALAFGAHVICEKPMALSTIDARKMIDKATKVNKNIYCVMQNRYSPSAVWLKELMTNNTLGNIHNVVINCFWNRDNRYYAASEWRGTSALDGGVLFTQFSHFLDTIYWLFGEISDVQTKLQNFAHLETTEFADSGISLFKFDNGGLCTFSFSTTAWDKNFESSIAIVGSKGSVKVGGQYMNQIDYCHIENYTQPELMPSLPPNDYGFYKGSAANHDFVIQNVIDNIIYKKPISATAEEGLQVVHMIEQIYNAGK